MNIQENTRLNFFCAAEFEFVELFTTELELSTGICGIALTAFVLGNFGGALLRRFFTGTTVSESSRPSSKLSWRSLTINNYDIPQWACFSDVCCLCFPISRCY